MDRIAKRNLREEWRLQARPARMFAKAAPVGLFALESDAPLLVIVWSGMHHIWGRVSSHNAVLFSCLGPVLTGQDRC